MGAGIGSILTSFVFVFPYIGFIVNRQIEHVTASSINLTGLSPQDPINLFIFAVLFFSGIGLIVKGFYLAKPNKKCNINIWLWMHPNSL
jgi:hypothetical protein